jgi:SAM-dependent methyltransferase
MKLPSKRKRPAFSIMGMRINKCRVCGNKLFEESLLRYENMPRAAQFLPEAESLEDDKGVDLEVCQCSGCGLVQLSSGPVPYYKEVIRAAAFSEEMKKFRREQFGRFIQKYFREGKKIVEIGCGCGEYLSILQECGAQVYGLEHSEESVMQCVKKGLKVATGFVENNTWKINDSPFDGFLMLSFLEHLPDPNGTVRGISYNLTDEAVGLVEVPNFDMILRNRLFSEFISDHLLYFTKETLTTALDLNGFEILACNEVWHDYIISAEVRKRKPLKLSHFHRHQEKLQKEIQEYINRFDGKKVAVWGAGHQALAILSLTGVSGKIKCVVDSAVFKQGKFTPATHIPIVSPDTLKSEPVDAFIVMAAGYSDEVAMMLRQKFDHKIHIAIVRNDALENV